MKPKPHILVVESDPSLSKRLQETLKDLGFEHCSASTPDRPIDELAARRPSLTIIGPSLEKQACLKCIHKLGLIDPHMPLLCACRGNLLDGSFDGPAAALYPITPELDGAEIEEVIHKALERRTERKAAADAPVVIIGQSPEIMNIRRKIQKVSNKDVTVLVTGETGTGKELIARSLHYHSHRNPHGLVKINCGALPDHLLESEIFGFQRGAFTGAHKDKPGRLEMAHGGTLFIDEIGDLSLNLQVKLLQIFEDKAFSRLGGTEDEAIDTRVVAATNSDLRKKVEKGSFRKDLFYRLNKVHIHVPPLRKRKGDIPLLSHYYMNKYCFELRKEPLEIPAEIADLFLSYPWPGNVRQLENVIRRGIVHRNWNFAFAELRLQDPQHESVDGSGQEVHTHDLGWSNDIITKSFREGDFSLKKITKTYVSQAERVAILEALKATRWNRKKAAQLLGVSYKTLLNRIREFDLKP
jgi:two-component system response regulator AtoC